MKNAKYLLICQIIILFCISCEKQSTDYRNKYLGNWKFTLNETHTVFNLSQMFHDTTVTSLYYGQIKSGSGKEKILFQANGYSSEFSIDEDGQIIPVNVFGPNYSEGGGFEGTDIFNYYYSHHMGASVQHYGTSIEGLRE
jgi:hypothetical protein